MVYVILVEEECYSLIISLFYGMWSDLLELTPNK